MNEKITRFYALLIVLVGVALLALWLNLALSREFAVLVILIAAIVVSFDRLRGIYRFLTPRKFSSAELQAVQGAQTAQVFSFPEARKKHKYDFWFLIGMIAMIVGLVVVFPLVAMLVSGTLTLSSSDLLFMLLVGLLVLVILGAMIDASKKKRYFFEILASSPEAWEIAMSKEHLTIGCGLLLGESEKIAKQQATASIELPWAAIESVEVLPTPKHGSAAIKLTLAESFTRSSDSSFSRHVYLNRHYLKQHQEEVLKQIEVRSEAEVLLRADL